MREPDDVNIKNIKNRMQSDPVKHEEYKRQKRIEEKLTNNYTKDDKHNRILSEIEKTYEELYGDSSSGSSSSSSSGSGNRRF